MRAVDRRHQHGPHHAPAPQAPIATPVPRPAERAPRVLMVGDSVGYSLSESLAEVGRASAIDVAVRAAPGCSLTEERAVFQNGPETQPAAGDLSQDRGAVAR